MAHTLQPMHTDGCTTTGLSLPVSKTPVGQDETHAPHCTQRFFSIFGSIKSFLLVYILIRSVQALL
jgi:hypothetical protein